MTSIVDMNESLDERSPDPFEGEHIEVEESQLRKAAAPAVVAGRIKRRLDAVGNRLTWRQ